MFILRVIIKTPSYSRPLTTDTIETNQILGDSYNLIDRSSNPVEFESVADVHYGKDADSSDSHRSSTYAFIIYNHGSVIRPLYKNQDAYIMTSEGKTFNHIKE